MEFVATNIRLPKRVLQDLKLRAVKENKSMAGLIREALEKAYGIRARERNAAELKKDPFFKVIGMVQDGIGDGSVHHDRDIYGIEG